MMNKEFFQALDELEREYRIPKESMVESIEAGMASAKKKNLARRGSRGRRYANLH